MTQFKTFTDAERAALRLHGLDTHQPSQLSDAFVLGMRHAQKTDYGQRLTALLLAQPWHERCEIIPNYIPPYPREDTRPSVRVRYNDGSEHPPFLRYSRGPRQGFFWDIYGEDMQSIELAVLALHQAPAPRDVGPITFTIPLKADQ